MRKDRPPLRICDLHCDSAQLWQAGSSLEDTSLHVNLPSMARAGAGLQVFAAYVPPSLPAEVRFSLARRGVERIKAELDRFPSRIVLCRNSREVAEAADRGRIAALLAVENGDAIEGNLDKLRELHEMGVRLMTLIHVRSNDWVISSADREPAFDGLSPFGAKVVEAMNRLGMIIDVSHAHDRAVEKVLEHSSDPIVASHSCMHTLCPIPRNLRDELILGIAAAGGVVGVNFHPAFLDSEYRKKAETRCKGVFSGLDRGGEQAGADPVELGRAWMRFTAGYRKAMAGHRLPLERLLRHIDHLVELAGENAAAFGSDFDGIPDTPAGLDDYGGFVNIVAGLRARGYPRSRLEKICWANFIRVLGKVCG
jgi:membrane dipeptidase